MKRVTIPLLKEEAAHKGFAICYAGGVIKHKRAGLYEVEPSKRREVSKVLCITRYFGHRCKVCPFSEGSIRVRPQG